MPQHLPAMCPSSPELLQFARGELDGEPLARVEQHLLECDACPARLAELSEEGSLFGSLAKVKQAQAELQANESAAALVMRRVLIEQKLASLDQVDSIVGRTVPLTAWSERTVEVPSGSVPGQPPAPSAPSLAGRQFREYQLQAKLGEGGMGTVYRALHTRLEKSLAIKILPAERMQNADVVARFQREMRAVGKLDHPNIVRATDAGEADGLHFLAMELVSGQDLTEVQRRHGPLAVADACEIIRQAALALQHAHEHGLVHRDVKPSNLMLTESGVVKLLDLGLARLHSDDHRGEMTAEGTVMGTVDYMAPEQATDSRNVDIRADLYSLGCTLYKLLTARPLFIGSLSAKLVGHATRSPDPVTEFRSDVPANLLKVLDRLLAKEPAKRFATPRDVVQAIEPFCRGAKLGALLGEALTPTQDVVATRTFVSEDGNTESQRPRREKAKIRGWVALAAAGVALLLAGAFVLRIATDKGELVITAPEPGVEVTVKRNGQPVKDLTLKTGEQSVQVYSGDVEVTLSGANADQYRVTKNRIELRRGEKVAVTIERQSPMIAAAPTEPKTPAESKPIADPSVKPGMEVAVRREPPGSATLGGSTPDGSRRSASAEPGPLPAVTPVARAKVVPIEFPPEPIDVQPGEPMGPYARVGKPTPINGLLSWSVENQYPNVATAEFNPDGRYLTTRSATDSAIRIWDLHDVIPVPKKKATGLDELEPPPPGPPQWPTPRLHKVLLGDSAIVGPDFMRSVAHSPDGSWLASLGGASRGGGVGETVVRIWETATGKLTRIIPVPERKSSFGIAWSPRGDRLAVATWYGGGPVVLVDFPQRMDSNAKAVAEVVVRQSTLRDDWERIVWSPDGRRFVTSTRGGERLVWWDAEKLVPEHEVTEEPGNLHSVSWSADGKYLCTGGKGNRLWNALSHEVLRELPNGASWRAGWSPIPGDQRLIFEVETGCFIWNVETSQREMELPNMRVERWSPDAKRVLVSRPEWRLVDLATGKFVMQLQPHGVADLERDNGRCVALSPDGSQVAVWRLFYPSFVPQHTDLSFWNTTTGELLEKWDGKFTGTPVWSPDGKLLASLTHLGRSNELQIFDRATGQVRHTLTGHTQAVATAAWSPDGKTLATGSVDGTVRLWQLDESEPRILRIGTAVNLIAWSWDNRQLAVATTDEKVRLITVKTGETTKTFDGMRSGPQAGQVQTALPQWSPDGTKLSLYGPLLDLASGQTKGMGRLLLWSPSTRRIAKSTTGILSLIETNGDEPRFTDDILNVNCPVTWFPDSRRIFAGPQDVQGYAVHFLSGYDVEGRHRLGQLYAMPNNPLMIGHNGHYHGSPEMTSRLVYVALYPDGRQETFTPAEFERKFGWKNDPDKALWLGVE